MRIAIKHRTDSTTIVEFKVKAVVIHAAGVRIDLPSREYAGSHVAGWYVDGDEINMSLGYFIDNVKRIEE
jgi:hypothetical protein